MRCGYCKADGVDLEHIKAEAAQRGDKVREDQRTAATRHHSDRRATIDEVNRIGLTVPPGRYALPNGKDSLNKHSFYIVQRPDEGKWAGKTFVKRYSSDDETAIPIAQAVNILSKIAADPMGAMLLFGQLEAHCGHCGRRLTNDDSRARGIGPVCARHMGFTDVA